MEYKVWIWYTLHVHDKKRKSMPVNSFDNYRLTWMPRLEKKDGSIYLSLASLLRGLRLPPQRELSDWLDIDLTTVTRAYNVCKEKKLIYGITGRGTFVSPAPSDATPPSSPEGRIFDFSAVGGFPMISSEIVQALRHVACGGHLDRLFSYSDIGGSEHQIAAGRHLLELNNIKVSSGRIAIFAGAQNAIAVALFSLFSPGDAIAADPYTYSNLMGSARMAHIRLVPVAGDGDGMRADALESLAAKRRIKGLFLMPNAANPTGITMPEGRRDEIAAVAEKHSLVVIEDDISPFAPCRQRRPFFSRLPDSTMYIAAYAALLAPGFRVTYGAFPERFRQRLLKGLSLLNIKAGSLDAEVLSELILSGGAKKVMRAKRNAAEEANAVFDCVFGDGGSPRKTGENGISPFFRTLDIPPSGMSGPEIEDFFLRYGIKLMHSCRFAVDKAVQRDFLRVSISSMRSKKQLEAGLVALYDALADFRRRFSSV